MTFETHAAPPKVATVFGGTGFIGRRIVDRLTARGYWVRVVTRRAGNAQFLRTAGVPGQVATYLGSIHRAEDVARAVEGAALVVNLIATMHDGSGRNGLGAVNVHAARRIATAAAQAGVQHYVHVSALGAVPQAPSKFMRSKEAGEAATRAAFPRAYVLRPSLVFGPGDHFFNRFARMGRGVPALPLFFGGATRFQPVYVGDVARAATALLEDPSLAGAALDLGGPHIFTYRQLMEQIAALTGHDPLLLPLPGIVARPLAGLLGLLPGNIFSRDQLAQLAVDNVVPEGADGFARLGFKPQPLAAILPAYLIQYRPGGRFGTGSLA